MAIPIAQDGDPVLRDVAREVTDAEFGTTELSETLALMEKALEQERDGVAIAAPQVGISLRIFLVRYDRLAAIAEGEPQPAPEIGFYINPEILRTSRRRIEMDEGCLSVRRIYGKTIRFERATVRAQQADGSVFERGGGGILAQVFQHEIDHLNGFLFIDHAHDMIEISDEQLSRARQGGVNDAPELTA
jgi:peptide deformylase